MTLMTLNELAKHLGHDKNGQSFLNQTPFSGLSQDTRHVKPGDIFVVIPCDQAEVHARAAVKAGAVALVVETELAEIIRGKVDVPVLTVSSARRALSQAAALLYPHQPEVMVAVTGTNGKSSVVSFVRQIWQQLGFKAASFGTLGVEVSSQATLPQFTAVPKLTTPGALAFHHMLNTLADSGITNCVFEASSHGLDQYRLHDIRLTAAGFTNLSQDHLDYHESMEGYFDAKSKLFTEVLPPDKTAVINMASPYFPSLKAMILGRGQKLLAYGVDQSADLKAENIRLNADEIICDLTIQGQTWRQIPLKMVGAFQVENVLCAIGLVLASGAKAQDVVDALPYLRSAPGRMELVGKTSQDGMIFVDYAHTPDALKRALESLREHVTPRARLRVVFGCGGNRDAGKRVHMGQIATMLADDVYITDDNPRDEDPAFIRAQILVACPKALEVGDRRKAIQRAIGEMDSKDILLIAGKGHEQGQIVGDRIMPFDDRTEVQEILKNGEKS